ncbi:MAG: ATP-binding protein [Spirochaetia bacterium]|nr:ATP-binding protein [Spirochaetia bacterium]
MNVKSKHDSFGELREILDSLIFPVIAVNTEFQVMRLNRAALERSSINQFQKAIGEPCYSVLYSRNSICPYCPIQENPAHPEENSIEKIIQEKVKSGEEKTLRLLFHKIDSKNFSFLETIEDITSQRELQEEAVRFERLAAIGTMVSGIAHELNNPLTGMGLTLQNLKANISTMSQDEINKRMNLLNKDLDRASRVVDDILTFSRPGELKLSPGDVVQVIKRAIANIQRLYPVLSRRVNWELTGEAEIITDINSEKLERVFINLFKNALHAFDYNEGTIMVDIKKTEKWTHIIIEDNAGGIPGNLLNKIFHPFFTNSQNKKGTGLGLTLCHSIITEHKGKIRARSLENHTKFYLSLPLMSAGTENG